jgi:hypothetical protein
MLSGNMLSGKMDNIFTKSELDDATRYLGSSLPSRSGFPHSVYPGHILYERFNKNFFRHIQELYGSELQCLFVGYLNESKPFALHSDYFRKLKGEPRSTFLIPISVDHDVTLVDQTYTIIFNEEDTWTPDGSNDSNYFWKQRDWHKNKSVKENNALQYFDQYLSHNTRKDLECLTVQNIFQWQLGSILHWNSRLLHCSDNFITNGFQSKQALVIHTYVL